MRRSGGAFVFLEVVHMRSDPSPDGRGLSPLVAALVALFLIGQLVLGAPSARAQVASCPTATYGAAQNTCTAIVPENAPQPTTLVLWCEWGSAGATTCPGWSRWIKWSDFGDSSLVLTTYAGLQRKGSVTFAATPAPTTGTVAPPPPCWPLKGNFKSFPVPASVTTRFDRIVLWACDTPTGYWTHSQLFAWARLLPFTSEYPITKERADELYVANALALTKAEADFGSQLREQYLPTAVVAVNSTSATRPRYVINANGTRGVRSGSVAVGAPCLPWKRVAGTNYYALRDDPGFAAVCTVTLPLGAN